MHTKSMLYTTNRMVKILSYNAVRVFLTILSGLLTPLLLVRNHELSGLGYFSLASAYAAIIYLIFDFGLNTFYSRNSAKIALSEQSDHFWGTVLLKFLSSLLAGLVILLVANLPSQIVNPQVKELLFLYAIGAPLFMLQSLTSQAFLTLGFIKIQLQSELLNKVIYLLSLGVLAFYMQSLQQFVYPLLLAYLVQLSFLLTRALKVIPRERKSLNFLYLVNHLKSSLQFYLFTLVSTLYGRVDVLTLSFISTPVQVGIYALAYRGAELLAEIGYNISNYFYRDLAQHGQILLLKTNQFLLKLISLLGLLGLAVATLFAPFLKIDKKELIFPIFFMILCGGLMALNQITRSYLTLNTNMRVLEKYMIYTILVEFLTVLFLGYRFGGLGATIGVFVAEFLLYQLLSHKAIIRINMLFLYPLPILLLAIFGYLIDSNLYLLGITTSLFSLLVIGYVINFMINSLLELKNEAKTIVSGQSSRVMLLYRSALALNDNLTLLRQSMLKLLSRFSN